MAKCLLVLCLYVPLCHAQLATTDDGSQLLLPTFWQLAGESFERGHFGIYRSAGSRWTALAHTNQGPVLSRPFLSADGSVAAWDRYLPCTGSCMLAVPRTVTEFQGVTPPSSIGAYNLTLSRNARFLLAPGFMGFNDFVLLDLLAGRRWAAPEVPTLRTLGVANTGAVIGLAAAREGSFSNPVVPNRVVVWRPTGESIDVFQGDTVANASISADGARALIEVAGASKQRELWWVDIATQNRTRIVELAPDGPLDFPEPANPQLSNDGSRALYLWPSQNKELWLWQEGTQPRVLARTREGFLSSALSGDGRVAWALTVSGRLLRLSTDSGSADEVLPALPPRLDYGYAGTVPGSAMVWRTEGGITPGLSFTSGSLSWPVIDDTTRDSIAVQIPWEAPPDSAPLVVERDGDPFQLALAASIETAIRPVIAGEADALGNYWIKAAQQDFGSLVTPGNPAAAGSTIHTWLYNLGPLDRPITTGAPGPSDPPAKPLAPLGCFLLTAPGAPGRALEIPFLAYAPNLIGVYQADIAIPADWPSGNAYLVCDSLGVAASALLPVAAAK